MRKNSSDRVQPKRKNPHNVQPDAKEPSEGAAWCKRTLRASNKKALLKQIQQSREAEKTLHNRFINQEKILLQQIQQSRAAENISVTADSTIKISREKHCQSSQKLSKPTSGPEWSWGLTKTSKGKSYLTIRFKFNWVQGLNSSLYSLKPTSGSERPIQAMARHRYPSQRHWVSP